MFNCEPYLEICGAKCCACFPMPLGTYQRNTHKICREVAEIQKVEVHGSEKVILLTCSMLCAFLDKNYKCNIYEDRPEICRNFGNEKYPFMHCPFQHTDGTKRKKPEVLKKYGKYNRDFREK
ncbi:MAG: YkgJ family cysteine cluster protein [Candidatus Thorarchaeota archaeon]